MTILKDSPTHSLTTDRVNSFSVHEQADYAVTPGSATYARGSKKIDHTGNRRIPPATAKVGNPIHAGILSDH
jgi:hypothetical protein